MLQGKKIAINCTSASIPNWVKIPFNKVASTLDHTYVECVLNGKTWGCHGRSSGGAVLSSGTGCEFNADCIYGNDEAGIVYLLTGVCHQIANRTLISAGVTVHRANGYFLSSSIYGEYGLYQVAWNDRKRQCNITGSVGVEHENFYRALIAKRTALIRYLVPLHEIDRLFPAVKSSLKPKLQQLTTDWKLKFLEHAINYFKNKKYQNFYNQVHIGLNQYANDCAEIIGIDAMAGLLGIEEYDERMYILLFHPENQS